MSLQFMSRLLDLFAPQGRWDASGLETFRSLLLLHALVRTLDWVPQSMPGGLAGPWIILGMRILLVVTTIASVRPRLGRAAAALGALIVFAQVLFGFPEIEDQVYLELCGLALCALFDASNAGDGPLLRSALCWMGALVLFHSGFQKVLHGYYFFAEFPAYAIAAKDPIGGLFGWLVSTEEVGRLQGLNLFLPEAGPFLTDSTSLVFLSNAVWVLEIELAVMMMFRLTRNFAAVAAIAMVVVIQLVGHQPLYALLLAQFFLLCIPGEWHRRLALVFGTAYAAVALAQLGILPKAFVLRETPL